MKLEDHGGNLVKDNGAVKQGPGERMEASGYIRKAQCLSQLELLQWNTTDHTD